MNKIIYLLYFLVIVNLSMLPLQGQAQDKAQITLAGYKHIPPVPSNGSAFITVELQGDTLQVHGEFEGLNSWYTGAYIMVGEEGETGNQLLRLKASVEDSRTEGTFEPENNNFELREAHKELLRTGELYINIASGDHRRGELRGQIPALGN